MRTLYIRVSFLLCLFSFCVSQFVCDTPLVQVDSTITSYQYFNCTPGGFYSGIKKNGEISREIFTSTDLSLAELDPQGNQVKTLEDVFLNHIATMPPENFPIPPQPLPPDAILTFNQLTRSEVNYPNGGRLVRLIFNSLNYTITYWDICLNAVDCEIEVENQQLSIPAGRAKITVLFVTGWPYEAPDNVVISETALFGSEQLVDCSLSALDDRGEYYKLKLVGINSTFEQETAGFFMLVNDNYRKHLYKVTLVKYALNGSIETVENFPPYDPVDDGCGEDKSPRIPRYSKCIIRNTITSYVGPVLYDPSIAVLIAGEQTFGCDSSVELNKPILIASGISAGVCIILIVAVIVSSEFPPCKRLILGKETSRINSVRKRQRHYMKSGFPSLDNSNSSNSTQTMPEV